MSRWKQIATLVQNPDPHGGYVERYPDGGSYLCSEDGLVQLINHAQIVDRFHDSLEAFRLSRSQICPVHGLTWLEGGEWMVNSYAEDRYGGEDVCPLFVYLAHHTSGDLCLELSALGVPSGGLIGIGSER